MIMTKLNKLMSALALLGASATVSTAYADQNLVDRMSQQLHLNYAIVDNHAAENGYDCSSLGADWGACNKVTVSLTNNGAAIEDKDWAIYFHSIRQILKVDDERFKITFITGDLHKLEPTDKFHGFAAGAKVDIPLIVEYWQIFKTDVMPRWYVVSGDAKPKVISNTDTEDLAQMMSPISGDQWMRTKSDGNILMTAQNRYDKNHDVVTLTADRLRGQIVPTPLNVAIHDGEVAIKKGVSLDLMGLSPETLAVLKDRFKLLSVDVSPKGLPIKGRIDKTAFDAPLSVDGAYRLTVNKNGVEIIGFDESGLFYGVQSVISLMPVNGATTLPLMEVSDAPRFGYRSIFLDVGRNFHSKEAVLRLLDQMAAYKLNVFHFHLTDDEGWRIEIPGLPELTEVGSQRCHDLTETRCLLPQLGSGPNNDNMGSGYFSKADYIDIIRYAKARQIEVIPEIDMPAHARAAIVSMEARYRKLHQAGQEKEANEYRLLDPADTSNTTSVQFYDKRSYLNPCLDSSKRFVDKVISEVADMHRQAGQPLKTWHFGGDEAKNIRLGAGYQDVNAADKVAGKGTIDMSKEDKPWARSPACQSMIKQGQVADIEHLSSYFAVEVSKLVKAHGIERMQAWQDGLKDAKNAQAFATKQVGVNFWDTLYWGGSESANVWANKGYQIVITNPDYVYLDMPNEVNPLESGYYWATRYSDERKIFSFAPNNLPQNAETSVDRDGHQFSAKGETDWPGAYGLSAHLWSEAVRTDNQVEYMIYPRLLSVAERAWHRAEWELDYQKQKEFKGGETTFVNLSALHNDWTRFANLLGQRELAKIDKSGVGYRLPVPGAKIIEGKLNANVALPGLRIQYSLGNESQWQDYDANAKPAVTDSVYVRTVSPDGKRFSRVDSVSIK
jgi:hexosaminidase